MRLNEIKGKLNKKTLIILGVIVAIIVVAGVQMVMGARQSPDDAKQQMKVIGTSVEGWRIKNDARVDANQTKIADFKRKLMNYYDPTSGALAGQLRVIDSLVAANKAAANEKFLGNKQDESQKIKSFKVTNVNVQSLKVSGDSADLTADVEFNIDYRTQAQNYSTLGKNTYHWELKNFNGKWKITKEELVPGAQQ